MIYTFYSFKGGVGRSMAMANVAEWFYQQGLRVVIIDWDLEAPGLENFFYSTDAEIEGVRSKLGLIDMLMAYKRIFPRLRFPDSTSAERGESNNSKPASAPENSANDWLQLLRDNLPPILDVLYPIHAPNPTFGGKGAALWLIPAGWRSGDRFPLYAQAVQSFDWTEFYTSYEGAAYFDWMREQLLVPDLADVVLIDSRTGVTEMGGVCTRQMADIVVSFCVPNSGNLGGVQMMAKSFTRPELVEERQRPLEMVVVPSRLDISEVNDRLAFEELFRQILDGFTPSAFKSVDSTFWDLQIQYVPKFAYREGLAIGDPRVPELDKAYKKLAAHLALLAQGASGERVRTKFADPLQREFASHLPGLYQLTEEERARYLQLAFFPEDAIPLSDAQELWESDAPSTEKLVRRLAGISLLAYDPEQQTIQLNSVLRAQLLEQMPDQDALNEKIEAAFGTFSAADQEAARRILTRLVRLVSPDETGNDTRLRVPLSEWDASSQAVVEALAKAKLVTIEPDKSTGAPVVQITNEAYLRGWRRLADWRIEDREFLLWRQQLKSKIAEWEATKHDRGALLSGLQLAVATTWRERRPDELNVSETAYIEESVNELKRSEQVQQESAKALRRRRWWIAAVTLTTFLVIFAIPVTVSVRQRRAAEQRRQAEEVARKKAEDLNNSGSVELGNDNYELAIKDFNEAIKIKPDYAEAYLNRARAYSGNFKKDQAIADYSQAIQLKPDLAVAYFERAELYSGEDESKAIADYTSAIKVKPDYWNAYLARGTSNEFTTPDAAIADFTQIIQSSAELKVKAQATLLRGSTYERKADLEHARADFLSAIALTADPFIRDRVDAHLRNLRYRPPPQDPVLAAPNIFLQYIDAKDGTAVEAIGDGLEKNGFHVQSKDLVKGSGYRDVRYYSRGNIANAEKIRSIVADTLANQSKSNVKMDLKVIYFGDTYPYVPRDAIDVWIPSLQKSLQPIPQQPVDVIPRPGKR